MLEVGSPETAATEEPAPCIFSLMRRSASAQVTAMYAPSAERRSGVLRRAGLTRSSASAAASAVMAPWVTGLFLSPMVRTGVPATVRTRKPVPEGQSLLAVGRYSLAPFFRRGSQPQFCVQYTAS